MPGLDHAQAVLIIILFVMAQVRLLGGLLVRVLLQDHAHDGQRGAAEGDHDGEEEEKPLHCRRRRRHRGPRPLALLLPGEARHGKEVAVVLRGQGREPPNARREVVPLEVAAPPHVVGTEARQVVAVAVEDGLLPVRLRRRVIRVLLRRWVAASPRPYRARALVHGRGVLQAQGSHSEQQQQRGPPSSGRPSPRGRRGPGGRTAPRHMKALGVTLAR
mmetsp:Transcript_35163/g.109482  ORF Transcript_35163/g.109482 Transcript_35163/m.109482 type:complete len:217 (-) Transcript_35163:4-654(-)